MRSTKRNKRRDFIGRRQIWSLFLLNFQDSSFCVWGIWRKGWVAGNFTFRSHFWSLSRLSMTHNLTDASNNWAWSCPIPTATCPRPRSRTVDYVIDAQRSSIVIRVNCLSVGETEVTSYWLPCDLQVQFLDVQRESSGRHLVGAGLHGTFIIINPS